MSLLDALLPLSALLFVVPISPMLSSVVAITWVILRLLLAPIYMRWATWPAFFLISLFGRSWFLGDMSHPISYQDAILFVCSLLAGSTLGARSWKILLKILALCAAPLMFFIGTRPWTSNPMAGPNQCAFVLGIIFISSFAWFSYNNSAKLERAFAFICFGFSFVMIWQTASRAAILSSLLSVLIYFLITRLKKGAFARDLFFIVSFGSIVLSLKQWLRPSIYGVPGIDLSSDLGRLSIAKCYLAIPFSGSNRLLYGTGIEKILSFCRGMINGGFADHSHNLFIQIFSSAGLLGLFGLLLLLYFYLKSACSLDISRNSFLSSVSIMFVMYLAFQSFADISAIHWPLTIVLSGALLSVPLAHSQYPIYFNVSAK